MSWNLFLNVNRIFFFFTFVCRYYQNPKPNKNCVLKEVCRLRTAVCVALKNPRLRKVVTVEFREDVFRFLFKTRGIKQGNWQLLQQGDFSPTFFPLDWHCVLDLHGQGTKMLFPVKIKQFIAWSPKHFHATANGNVAESARAFQEKVSLSFIKVAA